jgi:ABC-type transport system involved in multi-copper enzyme maturation permease subunit
MKKFLQIEYLKIKGNNSFKVFSLIFIVFLPILVILLPSIWKDSFIWGENSYPFMPRMASVSWYYTTYVASWFSLFILSFIIIFHITNEYAAKTVRQNIIDGYSKLDFLKSKLAMVLFMAVVATAYVFIVGLIAGIYFSNNQPEAIVSPMIPGLSAPYSGDFGSLFDGVIFLLGYFLQVLGYFVLAVLVSVMVRKGALAVIIYFALFFLEMIFILMNSDNLEGFEVYFPLSSFSSLLPFFGFEALLTGLGEIEPLTLTNAIVSTVYIALFVLLTRYMFFKRDVV